MLRSCLCRFSAKQSTTARLALPLLPRLVLGRRLAKPQRQTGAPTAHVLAVIRLTAVQPRKRGRSIETAEQAGERGKVDVALVAVLSDGGLCRSEAASLTWGHVQRWDDGSGRITVVRSKTDVEAQGAVVAITPAAMRALDAIRPALTVK